MSNTDKDWEYYGKTNPYYGVVSHEEFRTKNLDNESAHQFFTTGKEHIDSMLEIVCKHLVSDFKPRKALDFGCGVGRLVIPLSSFCDSVVGVDVSESMLKEARKNCQERGISNVDLIQSDDNLSKVNGSFDLVHSYIVFQHIPYKRGEVLFKKIVTLLEEGGVGILHVTYNDNLSLLQKTKAKILLSVPFAVNIVNLLKRKPASDPLMQMNEYSLNTLLSIIQKAGCKDLYLRFTQHGGHFDGAIIFFQKGKLNS